MCIRQHHKICITYIIPLTSPTAPATREQRGPTLRKTIRKAQSLCISALALAVLSPLYIKMSDKQPLSDDLDEIVVLSEEATEDSKRPPSSEKKQKRWRDTSPSYASIAAESTTMQTSGSPPTYRFVFPELLMAFAGWQMDFKKEKGLPSSASQGSFVGSSSYRLLIIHSIIQNNQSRV